MNKIPYDLVAIEAEKILLKLLVSSDKFYYYDYYLNFIKACGWSDSEFDEETLNRVENNWELMLKYNFIICN